MHALILACPDPTREKGLVNILERNSGLSLFCQSHVTIYGRNLAKAGLTYQNAGLSITSQLYLRPGVGFGDWPIKKIHLDTRYQQQCEWIWEFRVSDITWKYVAWTTCRTLGSLAASVIEIRVRTERQEKRDRTLHFRVGLNVSAHHKCG